MGVPFESYLAHMKKTKEEVEASFLESARERVLTNLAFIEIAKENEIDPSAEEVQQEMNKILSQYGGEKDLEQKVDMERLYSVSRGQLIHQKVWEFLESL
jgi:FKBP-type peptidyl-prolyl cis-trans isomerase (trigger factor)